MDITEWSRLKEKYPNAILCSPLQYLRNGGNLCGYQNIRMMLTSINLEFSILEIQRNIEDMWKKGFDPLGYEQLETIAHTKKWIGSTEVVVFFKSLNIYSELYDIVGYSGTDIKHAAMLSLIYDHFGGPLKKYPLYLQYDGHSVVIVGIDKEDILIFDPNKHRRILNPHWFNKYTQYSIVLVDPTRADNGEKLLSSTVLYKMNG